MKTPTIYTRFNIYGTAKFRLDTKVVDPDFYDDDDVVQLKNGEAWEPGVCGATTTIDTALRALVERAGRGRK